MANNQLCALALRMMCFKKTDLLKSKFFLNVWFQFFSEMAGSWNEP